MSSVNDDICQITNNDTLVADIETLTTTNIDTKRTDYIKRIQLETNFYNVFRNTIRILFNDYSNSEKRKNIQLECKKRFIVYKQQIEKVIDMLHDLVGNAIKFSTEEEGFNYHNINENEIHNCIKLSKDKCSNDKGICQITDDICTLILPKNNLITENDNEIFYYSKMADELIRYNRIKSFIFKPQAYLSFGQIKYNLRDNEMLILQDLLTQEFFENLIPADINKYAKYNTYDTAEPIISQKYKKNFELDEIINPNYERDDCQFNSKELTIIKSITWNKCFPKKYKEMSYKGKSKTCTLYLIIDLIKAFKGEEKLIEDIKDDLINEYTKITENYKNSKRINTIIDILREEGQFDANQLQDGSMNFKQMISQEGFGAVNFDLWILLVKYKIPSIFISSKVIPETRFKYKEFVCYKNDDDDNKFAFIVIPAMYKRDNLKNPEYKLIVNENGEIPISLDVLIEDNCSQNIKNAISRAMPIKKYIDIVFEKRLTTTHPRRKPDAVNIEFIEVSETPIPEIEEGNPKLFKQKKGRKLNSKTILEEDLEPLPSTLSNKDETENEEFEIELPRSSQLIKENKKKKSRKNKGNKIKAYPTRKNKRKENINFDIVDEF
jgi:hypothetical protein